MPQTEDLSWRGTSLLLSWKIGCSSEKASVNVLGPKVSWTPVTLGGLSISSEPQVPSP